MGTLTRTTSEACAPLVQVEAYYMSSAAGHARVVFGNRRWGNSGYVAGGRQVARPTQPARVKVRVPALSTRHAAWVGDFVCVRGGGAKSGRTRERERAFDWKLKTEDIYI